MNELCISNARVAWLRSVALVICLVSLCLLTRASVAGAVQPAPAWQVTVAGTPSVLPAAKGKQVLYNVTLTNVGGAESHGTITIRDAVPAGLALVESPGCVEETGEVVCTYPESVVPSGGFLVARLGFEVAGVVAPGSTLRDVATATGGGAAHAAVGEGIIHVRGTGETGAGPGGAAQFSFSVTGPAGEAATQAGGHPTLVTLTVMLNTQYLEHSEKRAQPVEAVKDLVFYLPVGMLGNPTIATTCPIALVRIEGGNSGCPPGSKVGEVAPFVLGEAGVSPESLYRVPAEKGYAAEFAFSVTGLKFFLYASLVRHDGAYMVRVADPDVSGTAELTGAVATFYGDLRESYPVDEFGDVFTYDLGAFLTNPSDCQASSAAREASMQMNTWERPEASVTEAAPPYAVSDTAYPSLEGCERLSFASTLGVSPATTQADSPSAYGVEVGVPQAPNVFTGLATPPVRDVSVTLPTGTEISPSSANGLVACHGSGPEGIDIEGAESEEVAEDGFTRPAAGHCPPASQVANVTATTPLLAGEEQLKGHIYLAEPGCGGAGQPGCTPADAQDGNLFRLYLELDDPQAGAVVKLPGFASVNPDTGQITTRFDDAPQFPVSKIAVETNGGPKAPLENPPACGTVTSSSTVTPWGAPATPTSQASSAFEVTGCAGVFAPGFVAGSTATQANARSPFTLSLGREDGEQNISAISTTLPPGLLASVAGVAQCPEPQASQGGCPAASQIGTTTVAVGPGIAPYHVTGKVYFTGAYGGGPFGLSVVVPAVAGPFNLGNVIVRASIHVDPHTGQVTAVSNPFPQILDGVPLHIRSIEVALDNPQFAFNPTSCDQSAITGTIGGAQGASEHVSTPYATSGCRLLSFKPVFKVAVAQHTSRASGASLSVKVAAKEGPASGEANIRSVRVELPRALPSRLGTLKKACLASVFEANPANCPHESNVGTASASTPILAHPLVGPVYLVSYGNAAFPDLEVVLQGEGITLILDGKTDIKKGITLSSFPAVPDAPISSFELKLPAGPFSALTAILPASAKANYSLCGKKLKMPTVITAQNGAVIKQTTQIAITGCAKAGSAGKASHARAAHHSRTAGTTGRGTR